MTVFPPILLYFEKSLFLICLWVHDISRVLKEWVVWLWMKLSTGECQRKWFWERPYFSWKGTFDDYGKFWVQPLWCPCLVICTLHTGSCGINYSCILGYCTAIDILWVLLGQAWLVLKFGLTFWLACAPWISHSSSLVSLGLSLYLSFSVS